jgi:hypothetical protein
MKESVRKIENLHIGFWLLKDIGWVRDLHVLGIAMVVPTLFIALWLTWKLRHDFSELTHNIAVCCWITANAIWMVGEFFYDDGTRPYATIFFTIGIAAIALYYLKQVISFFGGKSPSAA